MSDYKFDILNTLVKSDDFENNEILFSQNLKKYEKTLQELYEAKFIDRHSLADRDEDGQLYNTGIEQTKITSDGRQYYYDFLLPNKQRYVTMETSPPTHNEKMTRGAMIYNFVNKYIVVIIFGLMGAIASYFTIWQFFISNKWFGY